MWKSKAEISKNRYLGSVSASVSPLKNLYAKSKKNMNSKSNSENISPPDPNIQISNPQLSGSNSFPKTSHRKPSVSSHLVNDTASVLEDKLPEDSSSTVKVVTRLRPANCQGGGFQTVRKISNDSVSVGDRKFTFDAAFDSNSYQEEVYQKVGAPLVKDALAGYNISVLAYGQSGSGKTYTMWGPQSAMVEDPSASGLQGIVPRILQSLFHEIQKEQENSYDKQISFQCRCSFLEIYDEKIGDLLDTTQRNLKIQDDAKNGFYVENLTEEYVTSYEDAIQILIKGLSSRKIGATSINSKSSRSHIVFTFIIESWCKESSSKCFGSSKTSRISMVDLAGFERTLLDDASRQHVKEDKYVKKSTSQLGHLVNILAERSISGRVEDVPYRRSCLTHVLKESLGGNAKLSIICAISPDNRSNGETLSTLRFGQRAKLVKNEPVINEITEDDVDDLSNQIRLLKEELIKAKSNSCNSFNSNEGLFRGRSVRESVNQLRLSLNRSVILPCIEKIPEKEISINEDDIKELKLQIDNLRASHEEISENRGCNQLYSAEGCETDQPCEHYLSCSEESECEEVSSEARQKEFPDSAAPQDPLLSESPKISTQRKSTVFSSNHQLNQDVVTSKDHMKSSLRASGAFQGTTESLAASLHRGLQIIDPQRNSAATRSLASFSFEQFALKPCRSTEMNSASVQSSVHDEQSSDAPLPSFLCVKCQGREISASNEVKDSVNSTGVTKVDVEKDLAVAVQRENELDSICKEQAAEIQHLKQLLEQYNKNSIDEQKIEKCQSSINENKLLTRDSHKNPGQESIKEKSEIKEVQEEMNLEGRKESFDVEEREALLKEIEILKTKLQSNNATPTNKSVDRLRSSLLSQSLQLRRSSACARVNSEEEFDEESQKWMEMESLRTKLQSNNVTPTNKSVDRLRSSLLSQSIQLRSSSACARLNSEEEFEKERQKWMEMESDWILLTDELRIDLESNRQRAEKLEIELRLEKNCTEELDDALKRAVVGHARLVEHYADLQEKYNDLEGKHRAIMEGISEVKRAASKAGAKGCGSRFTKSLARELSALRMEKERERKLLRKENQSLRIQLKDTAEALHAAGELLARLREAEKATSVAEEKITTIQEENENLKGQMEKLKRKHKMEMSTMKQYLAESRLPQAALQTLNREDSDVTLQEMTPLPKDESWRAEFGAIYQEHY